MSGVFHYSCRVSGPALGKKHGKIRKNNKFPGFSTVLNG